MKMKRLAVRIGCVIGCRFYMLVDDGVILQFVALRGCLRVVVLLGWVLGSGLRLCTMINGSQCGRISGFERTSTN
ncbi:hypothetical protein M758_UG108100 [Ceratodon purpureus]|nr:hypothetical protein M758_UG108100 [Ceratodon purpureus]